jgi:DNA-binding transcriptional ArsR family regulator
VIQSAEAAATLFSMRILEQLAEPDSAAGVARRLDLPRQQVSYHLRELEHAGLVELVEERRKGNCLERVVRAAARTYVISPEALGSLGATPEQRRDRFSLGYLVQLAARAIRDLAVMCGRGQGGQADFDDGAGSGAQVRVGGGAEWVRGGVGAGGRAANGEVSR